MKEKDLDKCLDNIIIDGLIKEAEQDNADFAAAMRKMSDKEFQEMVYQPVVHKSRFKIFRPWITAVASAAAVILIVLIPSINSMNARLCDSALYMSEAYITAPKGGFDISSASITQIKEELPNLERQYENTIDTDGKSVHYRDGFQDAGWTLAVAYLKLHKKSDAIKVLKTLASQAQGTPFGDHCEELLKQLD